MKYLSRNAQCVPAFFCTFAKIIFQIIFLCNTIFLRNDILYEDNRKYTFVYNICISRYMSFFMWKK